MTRHTLIATIAVAGLLTLIAQLPNWLDTQSQDASSTAVMDVIEPDTTESTTETHSPIETVQRLNIQALPGNSSSHYKENPNIPRPDYVALAPSLSGTAIDGNLMTDENNNLILSIDVRDTFDYFLNTIGEVDPETAISEIKALITAKLSEPARSQAITVLEDYLNYKAAALEILSRPLNTQQEQTPQYQHQVLKESLGQLQQLQQQYLSAELHEAFYADENAFAQYTLSTMEIQLNDSLSVEEKTQALMHLEEQLPESLKTSLQELSSSQEVAKTAQTYFESGDRDAYEAHLQANYSQDVVEQSLADFDQQQAFEQTYHTYRSALRQHDLESLSPEARRQLEDEIRDQYFEGHDRLIAKTKDNLQLSSSD